MKYIVVDSDLRPLRTHLVDKVEAVALLADDDAAHEALAADHYRLTWATRHGETRWFVFPR